MGNHDVGRAMGAGARAFWIAYQGHAFPVSKELALYILDTLASPWRGSDAEFDDEIVYQQDSLGRLIAIAFEATPEEIADLEATGGGNLWCAGPERRFRERYNFC